MSQRAPEEAIVPAIVWNGADVVDGEVPQFEAYIETGGQFILAHHRYHAGDLSVWPRLLALACGVEQLNPRPCHFRH